MRNILLVGNGRWDLILICEIHAFKQQIEFVIETIISFSGLIFQNENFQNNIQNLSLTVFFVVTLH